MARSTDKLRRAREAENTAALDVISETQEQSVILELGMMLGAVGTMNALANSLSSKTMRILQAIRDSKEYRQLGFERFDDFLNQHPYSPMKYDKFNAREKVLVVEGDAAFDTLNALGVPLSTRKLLKGSVTVEGDKIHIGQHDDEQIVSLKDRDRVVETIKALAGKIEEQGRTIERHAATIKRGEKDNKKLQKKLDEAQQPMSLGERTPFTDARTTTLVALGALIRQARALTVAERAQVRVETLTLLTEPWMNLHEALGFDTAPQFGDLTSGVSDSDLEELEN